MNKKEFLTNNLERINTVLSAKLGMNTKLEIAEVNNYGGELRYSLKDKRNLKDSCGIMTHAFKELHIDCNIYWNENNVTFSFNFEYEHINGGSNGCEFCRMWIDNENILHLL